MKITFEQIYIIYVDCKRKHRSERTWHQMPTNIWLKDSSFLLPSARCVCMCVHPIRFVDCHDIEMYRMWRLERLTFLPWIIMSSFTKNIDRSILYWLGGADLSENAPLLFILLIWYLFTNTWNDIVEHMVLILCLLAVILCIFFCKNDVSNHRLHIAWWKIPAGIFIEFIPPKWLALVKIQQT